MSLLSDSQAEVLNFANNLYAMYELPTSAFYAGTSTTCPNFVEVANAILLNEVNSSLVFSQTGKGSGSGVGAAMDFVYEIDALQRNIPLLQLNKSAYYINYAAEQISDQSFYAGETAKTSAYMGGNSPDQGISL